MIFWHFQDSRPLSVENSKVSYLKMFFISVKQHCSSGSWITKESNFLKHYKFQHHLDCLGKGGLSFTGDKASGVHINFTYLNGISLQSYNVSFEQYRHSYRASFKNKFVRAEIPPSILDGMAEKVKDKNRKFSMLTT